MPIALIAAMDKNRVIGHKNALPWHLPEDLKYFKRITSGKTVVMGRKTFESMNQKPLPNRRNIVLTQNPTFIASGCEVLNSVDSVCQLDTGNDEIMIIGGAAIYAAFLPLASRLYLNFIEKTYQGDTFFPKFDEKEWTVVSTEAFNGFSAKIFDRKG